MTQDKLIAMAKEAGFWVSGNSVSSPYIEGMAINNLLQSFAKLIRKEQIELDADIAESAASDANKYYIAEAIRNQEIQ